MLHECTGIFSSHINKNNTYIANIRIGDLENSNIKIKKPNEQRILDPEKVQIISKYQEDYYKKTGQFNFIGVINIHCCTENQTNYMVDGQHRYSAAIILKNKGYDNISLFFEILVVDSIDQLKDNFKIINENTPLPEFPEDIDKNILEEVCQHYFNRYRQIFKINDTRQKPYICKNRFQEAIGYLISQLNCTRDKSKFPNDYDIEDIKKCINNKNIQLGNWSINSWNEYWKLKKWKEYKVISDEYGFYLGMNRLEDEEYMYEWVKDIIKDETGHKVYKKKRTRKKKSLAKKIKDNIWKKYIPNKHEHPCLCCYDTTITSNSFHAGHVLSENNGGTNDIDNLRPICPACNSDMRTKHMKTFMGEWYPNNLEKTFPNSTNFINEIVV